MLEKKEERVYHTVYYKIGETLTYFVSLFTPGIFCFMIHFMHKYDMEIGAYSVKGSLAFLFLLPGTIPADRHLTYRQAVYFILVAFVTLHFPPF